MKKIAKNLFCFLCLVAAAAFVVPRFVLLLDRAIAIESNMQNQQRVEALQLAAERCR